MKNNFWAAFWTGFSLKSATKDAALSKEISIVEYFKQTEKDISQAFIKQNEK